MTDLTVLRGGKEDQTFSMEITYQDGETQTYPRIKETKLIDYVLQFTDADDASYLVNMETVKTVKTWVD